MVVSLKVGNSSESVRKTERTASSTTISMPFCSCCQSRRARFLQNVKHDPRPRGYLVFSAATFVLLLSKSASERPTLDLICTRDMDSSSSFNHVYRTDETRRERRGGHGDEHIATTGFSINQDFSMSSSQSHWNRYGELEHVAASKTSISHGSTTPLSASFSPTALNLLTTHSKRAVRTLSARNQRNSARTSTPQSFQHAAYQSLNASMPHAIGHDPFIDGDIENLRSIVDSSDAVLSNELKDGLYRVLAAAQIVVRGTEVSGR
ncbi:hypothetical protein OBBRIDRAFT_208855 [Obba rivulosa]|uniref:Uncharacterized protein n=1 Tax=Obba rivulosa TaxID=1052685 RepID=A0A8E2DIC1_9APHY|nr:hypothetical protein OBBRIDRAFT_208855 [Obba rivulosa]